MLKMWFEIIALSVVACLVNIPLGTRRAHSRKFSPAWLLWVHASIPLIILFRIALGMPALTIPINIIAAVIGQYLGGIPAAKKSTIAAEYISKE